MNISHASRRSFLKFVGLSAAAGLLSNSLVAEPGKRKANIGLQLYTVRHQIITDFDKTMERIAAMGYLGIETYALPDSVTLEHASKVFRDLHLKVLGMHVDLPVGEKQDLALKLADAYQCDRVIFPGWPEEEKYKDLETIKRTTDGYNKVSSFMNAKGLRFGLHNHWWEFEKHSYGVEPFYYLLKHVDPNVFFEIDTYWAKTAGRDPAAILRDFGKRAPLLHIKDGPAIKGDQANRQVPAGEGVMDFGSIVKAGGIHTEWMIVEFDEYEKDIFDGIQRSYAYLTSKGYATGRV